MTPIRHILAATDLSAPSLHAVNRGFQLAQTTSAHYTLVHALGLNALGPLRELLGEDADEVTRKAVVHQRQALEALIADPAQPHGVAAELRIEEGLASQVVPRLVDELAVDLAVVGARGQSKLQRLLLGSTASHLLRKSRCPVLVAKARPQGPYRRVLAAVDFSPASVDTLKLAQQIAPAADWVLLHAFDVPFEGMLSYAGVSQATIDGYRREARVKAAQHLHQLAAEAGLPRDRYSAVVEHGDATRLVLDQHSHYACDLIAMGKHGTHVTEELLLGSVTKRVLEEADSDVLVVVDPRPPRA